MKIKFCVIQKLSEPSRDVPVKTLDSYEAAEELIKELLGAKPGTYWIRKLFTNETKWIEN